MKKLWFFHFQRVKTRLFEVVLFKKFFTIYALLFFFPPPNKKQTKIQYQQTWFSSKQNRCYFVNIAFNESFAAALYCWLLVVGGATTTVLLLFAGGIGATAAAIHPPHYYYTTTISNQNQSRHFFYVDMRKPNVALALDVQGWNWRCSYWYIIRLWWYSCPAETV